MVLSIQKHPFLFTPHQVFNAMTTNQNLDDTAQMAMPFPMRLYHMLDVAEEQGFDSIVSWLPNNDHAFRVHQTRQFAEQVMPKFFNQTKYKSFQRQLNVYKFARIMTGGPQQGGYEHKYLVRGEPTLCMYMQRYKFKQNNSKVPRSLRSLRKSTELSLGMLKVDQILPIRAEISSKGLGRTFDLCTIPLALKPEPAASKKFTTQRKQEDYPMNQVEDEVRCKEDMVQQPQVSFAPFADEFLSRMPPVDLTLGEAIYSVENMKYLMVGFQMGSAEMKQGNEMDRQR